MSDLITQSLSHDTIAAVATPLGRGGVGIIRVSGKLSKDIALAMAGKVPEARYAHYGPFFAADDSVIDTGLLLFFPGPHSFTGEDVLEFQGHGGPVVLDCLLRRLLQLGARMARAGEFSERAFLNDKIDLVQAEAIADLIDSASEQAARAASRSLQGEFSARIKQLVESLIHLRIYVEAAIDFPDEEVDFLSDGKIANELATILQALAAVQASARQGSLLREGITVVIAGRPNAGKSSVLNCLSGRESAIVTEIAGTTRDVLREHIHIDGIPLHIIDTAGLRESNDRVEQEGIRRAWEEIAKADQVLLLVDSTESDFENPHSAWPEFTTKLPAKTGLTLIRNKIDLTQETPQLVIQDNMTVISLSAKQGTGIDLLKEHLKACVGYDSALEGGFSARRRHLDALDHANTALLTGQEQLLLYRAGELLAEELRQAQRCLSEITGEFTPDDLLGRIFSSFCIGK